MNEELKELCKVILGILSVLWQEICLLILFLSFMLWLFWPWYAAPDDIKALEKRIQVLESE